MAHRLAAYSISGFPAIHLFKAEGQVKISSDQFWKSLTFLGQGSNLKPPNIMAETVSIEPLIWSGKSR